MLSGWVRQDLRLKTGGLCRPDSFLDESESRYTDLSFYECPVFDSVAWLVDRSVEKTGTTTLPIEVRELSRVYRNLYTKTYK